MGIYEFALLNSTDQAQTVWTEGTHIASRTVNKIKKYNLYSLGNFYVEVLAVADNELIIVVSHESYEGDALPSTLIFNKPTITKTKRFVYVKSVKY